MVVRLMIVFREMVAAQLVALLHKVVVLIQMLLAALSLQEVLVVLVQVVVMVMVMLVALAMVEVLILLEVMPEVEEAAVDMEAPHLTSLVGVVALVMY